MIQEEIDSMQSQSKRDIRVNFDKVKSTLISRMRVLAKSGALAELMENSVSKQKEAA